MYHGTTVEAASRLVNSGEHRPGVDSMLADVAAEWNLPERELRDYCETERALFAVTRGPDVHLYLTSSHTLACAYAGLRGGESRHEIVTAAMLLTRSVEVRYADAAGRLACWTEGALVRCDFPFETLAAQLGGERQLLAQIGARLPGMPADAWAIDHPVRNLRGADLTVQPAPRILYAQDVEWWMVALGHSAEEAGRIRAELDRGVGPSPVSRMSPPHDAFWMTEVNSWLMARLGLCLDEPPVISPPG
jgi:hypothetical protein